MSNRATFTSPTGASFPCKSGGRWVLAWVVAVLMGGCTHAGSVGGKHPSTRDPSVPMRSQSPRDPNERTSPAKLHQQVTELHIEGRTQAQDMEHWPVETCRLACKRSVQICAIQQRLCHEADLEPTDVNLEYCRDATVYCQDAKRDCTSCSQHAVGSSTSSQLPDSQLPDSQLPDSQLPNTLADALADHFEPSQDVRQSPATNATSRAKLAGPRRPLQK